jgi:hypothetical protein
MPKCALAPPLLGRSHDVSLHRRSVDRLPRSSQLNPQINQLISMAGCLFAKNLLHILNGKFRMAKGRASGCNISLNLPKGLGRRQRRVWGWSKTLIHMHHIYETASMFGDILGLNQSKSLCFQVQLH